MAGYTLHKSEEVSVTYHCFPDSGWYKITTGPARYIKKERKTGPGSNVSDV